MWHYVSLFDSISKLGYVMKLQKDTNDCSTLILVSSLSCFLQNCIQSYRFILSLPWYLILRTSRGQYINKGNYKSEKWSNENFYRLSFLFREDYTFLKEWFMSNLWFWCSIQPVTRLSITLFRQLRSKLSLWLKVLPWKWRKISSEIEYSIWLIEC